MSIRRLVLDVDKVTDRPDMLTLARAIEDVPGVDSVNVTVVDIDIETVNTDVIVEGDDIDVEALFQAIADVGCVLHSVDQIVAGTRIIEHVQRVR